MKNETVYLIPKDVLNLAANEACLRLQNVQQIRSMAVKYWFFLSRDALQHLSGISLALYGQASRAISTG